MYLVICNTGIIWIFYFIDSITAGYVHKVSVTLAVWKEWMMQEFAMFVS